ncbi:MAG: hypothetical protein IPJ25_08380 [Rhodocyclaceae bacterium]|nr:hypothetical protein [Rhodocyclaceae bacterium]
MRQRDQCRWHHQQHHGEHPGHQRCRLITPATNLTETNAALTTSGTMVITDVDSATTFTALGGRWQQQLRHLQHEHGRGVDLHRQQRA